MQNKRRYVNFENGSHLNKPETTVFIIFKITGIVSGDQEKSNCTALNKWYVISVTWSNKKNLSNCWSNGIKIITFTSGDAKGSDYSFIGDLGRLNGSYKTYLSGCIGEIIRFHSSLTDTETSHIHQYLMRKWGI